MCCALDIHLDVKHRFEKYKASAKRQDARIGGTRGFAQDQFIIFLL
jgi:hypothetical protein